MTGSKAITTAAIGIALAGAVLWVARREPDYARLPVETLGALEAELEAMRQRLGIPGMSAAIADSGRIVWSRGFGRASREAPLAAGPDTIYPIASLTKPYASTILLQLAEEGRLDLQAPASRFGIAFDRSSPVRVWHLMSHTAGEPPGVQYRYDGSAFGALTAIIERVTGRSFAAELVSRIVEPLQLVATAPNPHPPADVRSLVLSITHDHADPAAAWVPFGEAGVERGAIESAMAQGYARAWGRGIWPSGLTGPMRPMPHAFPLSATAGLVASAPDVARFSIALDDGRLLTPASRSRAWTPPLTPDGRRLPYALGWFVQEYAGEDLVWHYGHAFESSSLLLKIPERRVTFVILANSDGLSRRRGLGDEADVTASPAARLFLAWHAASGRSR